MKFYRPVGAVRDIRELEFLVALHQTEHNDMQAWTDGSIDASDVKNFLMSRYGIKMSKEDVEAVIFNGLASGEVEKDACIDLLEIVAILIIPLLVKVVNTKNQEDCSVCDNEEEKRLAPPPAIIADVLQNILHGTLGDESEDPPKLTPELLKSILLEYGEFDTVKDEELISQMITMASGGDDEAVLDEKAFARALTDDVILYNEKNETKHSTILNDVFPDGVTSKTNVVADEENVEKETNSGTFTTRFSFSQIDFVADNVLSWQHVVLVWLAIVLSYWFYVNGQGENFSPCKTDSYGCTVANAILLWFQVMLKLVVIGLVFGVGLSFGNGALSKRAWEPIFGLVAIAGLIFFPAFYSTDNFVFNTDLKPAGEVIHGFKYILVIVGCLLTIIQLKNLLLACVNQDSIPESLKGFFAERNGFLESRSKQAGIYKVNQMVQHAYDLHKEDEEKAQTVKALSTRNLGISTTSLIADDMPTVSKISQSENAQESKDDEEKTGRMTKQLESIRKTKSTKAIALENYSNLMDKTESVGGVVWAMKGIFSGSLQATEGIWLSSRLVAAIGIQIIATIILFIFTVFFFGSLVESLFPDMTVDYSQTCFSTFDYSQCYFPYGAGFYAGVGICRNITLLSPDCLSLFEEIPIDSQFQSRSCELLDTAYGVAAAAVPSNWTCDRIFEWVEDALELNPMYPPELFAGCKMLSDADNSTLALWIETDEDVNEDAIDYCRNMTSYVYNEISSAASSAVGNLTSTALDFCLDIFETLNSTLPSMCDRSLYRAREAITTYEINYESETSFCSSVLSYCTPDPLDPTRGTCVIGERNLIPFQFDGSTCRDYPEINATMNYFEENVLPTIDSFAALWPKKWMVVLSVVVAILSGFGVAAATSLVYIPSSIHTILKFRSGVIPSLRDPTFLKYRSNLEDMTYLIGAMFWGLVITSVSISVVVSISVFLFVWQVSREIITLLAAQVIGIVVTVTIKMIACNLYMKYSHAGYYRKKPMSSNLFSIAMETWYLGLTLAFMLSRFVKFLLTIGLYVGRIDRPVLADGLVLDLDRLPRVYRQNLLSTESHRHPYIELLGLMYLMKIRHKDEFGTSSGTAWRLLFVAALMPWLKTKRIQEALAEQHEHGEPQRNAMEIGDEVLGGMLAINVL